ncbi:hypothetical protein [Candidatus Binatus sp.]|uniref:hypothetical protein n=1 Tax=Candidatus Binatus sp. TaxID=2811406 RepID=UPI002F91F5A4
MAAPQARAGVPGPCGKSYGFIINGADPSAVAADGSATLPGAITQAVGVGSITFAAGTATGCTATGEMIYNSGDIQTNPIGEFFGPSYCYSPISGFHGAPCFDGNASGADMTGMTLAPVSGPGSDGAFMLSGIVNYTWFDTTVGAGGVPFGFLVQAGLGSTTLVGAAVPGTLDTALPGNGAPVLNITLQRQLTVPVPTTYGARPYYGAGAIQCLAVGANSTDLVAAGQSAPVGLLGQTITGAPESVLGSIDIWAPGQAGGTLSFNANDNYVVAGSGNQPNNADCSFSSTPGEVLPFYGNSSGTPASEFADGTSNSLATLGTTGLHCDSALTAGAGYSTSGVQYGGGIDAQSYLITTALISGATGIVPVGGMSTCNLLAQGFAPPKLLVSVLATLVSTKSVAKAGYVNITNASQADCDINVSMTAVSDATCSLSLSPTNPVTGDSLGDPSNYPTGTDVTNVAQPTCTCSGTGLPADSITSTVSVSSEGCWLAGVNTATDKGGTPLSYTVTCKN